MVTQTEARQIGLLLLGSLFLLFGSMIAGRVERGLGVSDASFYVALIFAFFLFLIGGFFLVLVAVITREELSEFE